MVEFDAALNASFKIELPLIYAAGYLPESVYHTLLVLVRNSAHLFVAVIGDSMFVKEVEAQGIHAEFG